MTPLQKSPRAREFLARLLTVRCLAIGLACFLLSSCGDAVKGFKQGWNEAEVQGTWRFRSVEGMNAGESLLFTAQVRNSELILANDNTFKFVAAGDVMRGKWSREGDQVLLTIEEKNARAVPPNRDSFRLVGQELIHKFDNKAVVYAKTR